MSQVKNELFLIKWSERKPAFSVKVQYNVEQD